MSEPEFVCILTAKCWGCQFGDHFDPPERHGWADDEDIAHAEATGQDVEAIQGQRCGCTCAVEGNPDVV